MIADPRKAAVLTEVFAEAYRTALNLKSSLDRLGGRFPLSPEQIEHLDEDAKDRLDAFRVRFTDLQDVLGGKLFRSLLYLEEEEPGSMLDILHQVEKRGLIPSLDAWRALRDVRNLLIRDYPKSAVERAEALTTAFREAPALLRILWNLHRYLHEHLGLDLEALPPGMDTWGTLPSGKTVPSPPQKT